jgi:hypothetical protein
MCPARAWRLCLLAVLVTAVIDTAAEAVGERTAQLQAVEQVLRPHEPLLAQLIELDSEVKRCAPAADHTDASCPLGFCFD